MAYNVDNFIDTITYSEPSGIDEYGDFTSDGSQATAAAYVVPKTDLMKLFDKTEYQVTAALLTEAPVTDTTLVWLPGTDTADVGEARQPKGVDKITAFWDTSKTLYLVRF